MAKPTNEGTFILKINGHAVSLTGTSELPQFVFQGQLVRIYDNTEEQWCDWVEYEQEARGYMVLKSKKGDTTLNHKQVMAATGWDGESYSGLSLGSCSHQRCVASRTAGPAPCQSPSCRSRLWAALISARCVNAVLAEKPD